MNLETRLAAELIRIQPARAATVLDRAPPEQAAIALGRVAPEQAAPVLAGIAPLVANEIVERLGAAAAAPILRALPDDVAARFLRRVGEDFRVAVLAQLPPRESHTLQVLLRFPENTAGALMDPDVLALAQDLTVAEAFDRIRDFPDQARYNLYIVDRDGVLVGAVNLRELLLAPRDAPLAKIMITNPHRLESNADRARIASHPGWKHVHAIPVVDERGCYLGSVRYRTLRQLEEELLGAALTDADTAESLGDIFASGASGMLEALTGQPGKRGAGWT
jgi:magnesium transporter